MPGSIASPESLAWWRDIVSQLPPEDCGHCGGEQSLLAKYLAAPRRCVVQSCRICGAERLVVYQAGMQKVKWTEAAARKAGVAQNRRRGANKGRS